MRYKPVGFELLPEKFTIPQLQQLYEAIYGKKRLSSNFRKKMISLNILIKLPEKDRFNSRRGAFLYKFEHKNYQMLQKPDYIFEIYNALLIAQENTNPLR